DRFKIINDSLGHLAGDDFLREIARRLQACVRKPDLVARLSGDEFVILIEEVVLDDSGRPSAAIAVARRVLDTLTAPLSLAGRTQRVADSLQRTAVDELTMEAELRLALKRDELEPYFQPIVRLADGAVVGHEALVRWNHPQRGLLRPADFLAVAEDSGIVEA